VTRALLILIPITLLILATAVLAWRLHTIHIRQETSKAAQAASKGRIRERVSKLTPPSTTVELTGSVANELLSETMPDPLAE
jgi:hypothetical protein